MGLHIHLLPKKKKIACCKGKTLHHLVYMKGKNIGKTFERNILIVFTELKYELEIPMRVTLCRVGGKRPTL